MKQKSKKKGKGGRPTRMTIEVLNKLNEAFAFDCTDEEACLYAEITPKTLYNYQKKSPEFLQRKQLLKQTPFLLARQSIISGFKGNPEIALKYMERKKKDEFSLRLEKTGRDGKDLYPEMSDDDLNIELEKLCEEIDLKR